MFKKELNINMELPEKFDGQELLSKWYIKGINKKIYSAKFDSEISASEAATRILEKELLSCEKITIGKKISVYGFHKNSKIHNFDPDVIAANAGYFSLKKID